MEQEVEIWKTIKKVPTFKISNKGNVWNRRTEIILKNHVNQYGYVDITLYNYKEKKQYVFLLHRLVASYFIDNIDSKKEVNHKDGNKLNNCEENLEWVTHEENMQHRREVLGIYTNNRGKRYSKPNLKKEDVLYIRNSIEPTKVLAEKFNRDKNYISAIKHRRTWKNI